MKEKRLRVACWFLFIFSLFLVFILVITFAHMNQQAKRIVCFEKKECEVGFTKKILREPLPITIPEGTIYVFNKKGYGTEISEAFLETKHCNGKVLKHKSWKETDGILVFLVEKHLEPESIRLVSGNGICIYDYPEKESDNFPG